jgi:hypothetical protein
MTHRVLTRTAQVSVNTPTAVQAYDFTGAAVSALTFSFVSRSLSTGDTLAYYADNGTGQYERGLGTWNATAFTLTRTTIRESSTGSAIVWTTLHRTMRALLHFRRLPNCNPQSFR